MNQSQPFEKPSDVIRFNMSDQSEIQVEAFLIEETGYKCGEKSEDEITKDALNRCGALWPKHPDPHFLLHDVLPLGDFHDHAVSVKLSSGDECIAAVFFCDYRGEGIKELLEVYLGRMNWEVLVGVDQREVEEADRKWFGWMVDEPPF